MTNDVNTVAEHLAAGSSVAKRLSEHDQINTAITTPKNEVVRSVTFVCVCM